MAKETKKSILEEAVSDLQKILEAADNNAMKKLAKEFPKNFDTLVKEELNKNKKESSKEPIVEGNTKESVNDKKKDKVNESVEDITEMSMDGVQAAYEAANPEDEFEVEVNPEGNTDIEITMSDIEEELASMEGMATDMEEANFNAENQGDPFAKLKGIFNQLGEMVQEMEDTKMHEEYGAMFEEQMTGLYGESFAETLGEETCGKLRETFIAHKKGEPFGDNSHASPNVNESEKEDQPFKEKSDPSKEQGQSIDENEEVSEMHDKVPRGATASPDKGHNTTPSGINEEDDDDKTEIEIEIGGEDDEKEGDEIDETAGSAKGQAANRTVGNENMPTSSPRKDSTQREFQKEAFEKRMSTLIESNKKVTKELNETKAGLSKAEKIVENHRNVLKKYRTQLSEMAIFNTNLANVNNLLVNEELALTTEDKMKIINKFKSVNSLTESQKVYKEVLTEMKEGKKTIAENVEDKMNKGAVGDSTGAQKIDEAVERTAFESTEHVNKIKNIMEYVEKGKRI